MELKQYNESELFDIDQQFAIAMERIDKQVYYRCLYESKRKLTITDIELEMAKAIIRIHCFPVTEKFIDECHPDGLKRIAGMSPDMMRQVVMLSEASDNFLTMEEAVNRVADALRNFGASAIDFSKNMAILANELNA